MEQNKKGKRRQWQHEEGEKMEVRLKGH